MRTRQPQKDRQQWQSVIEKYHSQVNLTQQQFCDAEQLRLGTFQKWLYRLAAQDKSPVVSEQQTLPRPAQPGPSAFGPVTISPSLHLASGCCMELPGNVRLHTPTLPSVEYLQNLVKGFGHEC